MRKIAGEWMELNHAKPLVQHGNTDEYWVFDLSPFPKVKRKETQL